MTERGTVVVGGHGRVHGTPDVWRARLSVTATRATVTAALTESEAAVRQVREALTARGVAAADAATGSVSIDTEDDYSGQRPRLIGYRAAHELAVVLRDLPSAGATLGDAVAAGGDAVRLQDLRAEIDDDAELRAAALTAAWQDAESTARRLAELAGRTLGAVLRIDRGSPSHGPRPLAAEGRAVSFAMAAPDVGLEPGAVELEAWVNVVWELV